MEASTYVLYESHDILVGPIYGEAATFFGALVGVVNLLSRELHTHHVGLRHHSFSWHLTQGT